MHTGRAHLVQGPLGALAALIAVVEKAGYAINGNADAYVRTYASFGIDEARELRERAASRSFTANGRTFIIATSDMTLHAQNALLKTLEEPPADARFYMLVPSPEMLLPTLRSRMQRLELPSQDVASIVDARAFLAAEPKARLEMLKPLVEKDDDEGRNVGAAITFLSSLEGILSDMERGSSRSALEAVYRARKYLSDTGSHMKALLEQVALLAPVVK